MTWFKCPKGHWLDTKIVGDEGTYTCAFCSAGLPAEASIKPWDAPELRKETP